MSLSLRTFVIGICLGISLLAEVEAEDAKPASADAGLAAANQLLRSGKFAEAEASYRILLVNDPKLIDAEVGLIRAMLRQQKIDEALDESNRAVALQPGSAALLAVQGDAMYRLGKMYDAEKAYLEAEKLDPKQARAYLGLSQLYSAYSLYRHAYDQLQTAHTTAPDDLEVQRAWLHMLPRKERLAALEAYLASPHPDSEEETQVLQDYLTFLRATADKPVHACNLVSKVEETSTKLVMLMGNDGKHTRGLGLPVTINDKRAHLLLDTGAGGITVTRKIAEKAGLTDVSAVHYAGIGDKGPQAGRTVVAGDIRIGNLEFQDCLVLVTDKAVTADEDGYIGADVFGAYLVDIDIPAMQLRLSPLPKRPEDTEVPTGLNSQGKDQANAESDRENSGELQKLDLTGSTSTAAKPAHLPKDRYIAPEMEAWTKAFRVGHLLLIPTYVNRSAVLLFGIDTGASGNILSLREARLLGKVDNDDMMRVQGLNGEVKHTYLTDADLIFDRIELPKMPIVSLDLSGQSRRIGMEMSGFLGFGMLRVLDIKLDYRDGLVHFIYDRKREQHFSR